MRVARCCAQRDTAVLPHEASSPPVGKGKSFTPEDLAEVGNMLRVLGEALEEVEILGGGKLAAVTNDQQLAQILVVSGRQYGRLCKLSRLSLPKFFVMMR